MSIKTGLEYVGCIDPWTDKEWLSDEEIVRCRDCIRFGRDQSDHEFRGEWWCSFWCTDLAKPEKFCAWGERRSQGIE